MPSAILAVLILGIVKLAEDNFTLFLYCNPF